MKSLLWETYLGNIFYKFQKIYFSETFQKKMTHKSFLKWIKQFFPKLMCRVKFVGGAGRNTFTVSLSKPSSFRRP